MYIIRPLAFFPRDLKKLKKKYPQIKKDLEPLIEKLEQGRFYPTPLVRCLNTQPPNNDNIASSKPEALGENFSDTVYTCRFSGTQIKIALFP
jgi:hypothetical protein